MPPRNGRMSDGATRHRRRLVLEAEGEATRMIEVQNVSKVFQVGKKQLLALKDISLTIQSGEVLGLVGESGCGKSTLGRLLVRLERPTTGQILFEGRDISRSKDRKLCQRIQMIFQDPSSSLNPRMTVGDLIR